VGQVRLQQRARRAPAARLGRRAGQGGGRHLDEHAALHERLEPLGLLLEGAVALRMGEQQRVAARLELEQLLLEQRAEARVGRLDQQVGAALAERGELQLSVRRLDPAVEVDLGARQQLELDARLPDRLAQVLAERPQVPRQDARVVAPEVRRADDRLDTAAGQLGGQGDALLDGGRAVVEARQQVAVQVDQL
jgi:hypothetical protein